MARTAVVRNANASVKLLTTVTVSVQRMLCVRTVPGVQVSTEHGPNAQIRSDHRCVCVRAGTALVCVRALVSILERARQNLSRRKQYTNRYAGGIMCNARRKRPDYLVQRHLFVYTRVHYSALPLPPPHYCRSVSKAIISPLFLRTRHHQNGCARARVCTCA